jgi:hypothetical protein
MNYDPKGVVDALAAHWVQAWEDFGHPAAAEEEDRMARCARQIFSVVLPACGSEFEGAGDAFVLPGVGSDDSDLGTDGLGKMPHDVERNLARDTATEIGWYRRHLEMWSLERGRRIYLEHAARVRRDACGVLSATRRMFDAQAALDDRGGTARRATLLLRLISDSTILTSTATDPEELARTPYLTREVLDLHLDTLRIDEWLRSHGAAIPEAN